MARKISEERIRRTGGERIIFGIIFAVFSVYALSIILTLLWAFLQSFKTNLEFWDNMTALPRNWLFSNYIKAFQDVTYSQTTFFGMLINSLWFAGGSAVISVFMHCVTGYVFAKYKFKGRGIAFSFILFTLTIPIVGSLPSLYKMIFDLQINDSPLFLITALGGFGPNFLVMYAFFKGIDKSYSEAAQIDGAGRIYIFAKIMLPFAIGPFFALSLLTFIMQWNNFETPLLFLDKMPTLSSGLWIFKTQAQYESKETIYIAAVIMSILPVIAAVCVFGGKIMKNVSVGGVKG